MTIQYINTGTSPNAGNGDSLRVAFSKINSNFSELYGASSVGFPSQIGHEGQFLTTDGGNLSWASVTSSGGGSGGTSTVIVSNVAPDNPVLGELWYDDISGRLYVWYDTFWVDASPRGNNVVSSLINGTYTFALSTSGSVSLNGTVFTGLSGPSGPQGNTGQGFNFRGAWSTTTSYVPYDVVTFGGGSFVNILATTSTNGPFTVYWNQIAAGGSPGAPGPTGPTGPSGPTGLLGILSTLTNGSYTASLDNSGNLIVPGGVYATGLYSSSGASVGNSSLIEGDTSAMTIPANGASDPLQLYNFYGPVTITSGVDNAHTEQWTFGTDGTLSVPGAVNYQVPGLGGSGHFDINSWYPVKISTGDGVDNAVATWTFNADTSFSTPGDILSSGTVYANQFNTNGLVIIPNNGSAGGIQSQNNLGQIYFNNDNSLLFIITGTYQVSFNADGTVTFPGYVFPEGAPTAGQVLVAGNDQPIFLEWQDQTSGPSGPAGDPGPSGPAGDPGPTGPQGTTNITKTVLLQHVASTATITGPADVGAWSAIYNANGGNVEIMAFITATESGLGGNGTFYLKRDGVTVDTLTFYFSSGAHYSTSPLHYIANGETGSHTYSISLGTGAKVGTTDNCLMIVTEY